MKKYLAIYLGTPAGMEKWKALDEAKRKEAEKTGIAAWNKWGTDNKNAIVDHGSPLGKTKRIDRNGISDTRNEMAAWTVVEAESHEAAAKLFEKHPHFMIFPGTAVEVMECLPMPQM
jgi:leucyl aminopeptidase (aminopeptidase T)